MFPFQLSYWLRVELIQFQLHSVWQWGTTRRRSLPDETDTVAVRNYADEPWICLWLQQLHLAHLYFRQWLCTSLLPTVSVCELSSQTKIMFPFCLITFVPPVSPDALLSPCPQSSVPHILLLLHLLHQWQASPLALLSCLLSFTRVVSLLGPRYAASTQASLGWMSNKRRLGRRRPQRQRDPQVGPPTRGRGGLFQTGRKMENVGRQAGKGQVHSW